MQLPVASSSSPRGSEDSTNTGPSALEEENRERKSSFLVSGTAPPSPNAPPLSPDKKGQTESETGWLRSLVMAEKEEKRKIQSKLDKLNNRRIKLERRLSVKRKEYEILENEAQSTHNEWGNEQKKYNDAMREIRARKDEIESLKRRMKDGELELEQERQRAKREVTGLNTVLHETSKKMRALKEDLKKDRREVNEVHEDKVIIELHLSWIKEDVKYFTEVEKRMKSLERQRLFALIVIVFIIVPLVVAHVAHVF